MSVRNVVAVAVAACLIVLVFLPADNSAGFAWSDVKDKVKKATTIQCVITEYAAGDRTQTRKVSRIAIRGRHLKREEVDDDVKKTSRISLMDTRLGKRVMIMPESKAFIIWETIVTVAVEPGKKVDLENAKKEEAEVKPQPKIDIHKEFMSRVFPPEKTATKRLPKKTIDGKPAIGFLFVEKLFDGKLTLKRTVWVDPKTRLPIRAEASSRGKDPRNNVDWVMSDFIFDQKLDDSLFSFEPPKGYTVEKRKLYSAKPIRKE